MTRSISPSQLGSEFNEFLFAPVADDGKGSSLSVLSALARQNVDPWNEAAVLAGLPRASAIERLAVVIAGLPGAPAELTGPTTVATRLIGLLPRVVRPGVSSFTTSPLGATGSPPWLIYIMMFMLLAQLAAQFFGPGTRSVPVGGTQALHASVLRHQTPPHPVGGQN